MRLRAVGGNRLKPISIINNEYNYNVANACRVFMIFIYKSYLYMSLDEVSADTICTSPMVNVWRMRKVIWQSENKKQEKNIRERKWFLSRRECDSRLLTQIADYLN